MNILYDEDDRLSATLQEFQKSREQGGLTGSTFELASQASTFELAGDVIERRERRWREERVAVTLENERPAGLRSEVLDEGGLTDASLAADKSHAPASGPHRRKGGSKRCQITLAFE